MADDEGKKEITAQWFEIGKDSPAKKKKKKDEKEDEKDKEDKDMEVEEPAGKSKEEEAASKKQAPKGKSKGKGKGKAEKSDFAESIGAKKKMELMEMLVKKLAKLADIHDAELRDIMAATEMTTYIIPESHPAVDAIKDKYQAYMDWIDEKQTRSEIGQERLREPNRPATGAPSSSTRENATRGEGSAGRRQGKRARRTYSEDEGAHGRDCSPSHSNLAYDEVTASR